MHSLSERRSARLVTLNSGMARMCEKVIANLNKELIKSELREDNYKKKYEPLKKKYEEYIKKRNLMPGKYTWRANVLFWSPEYKWKWKEWGIKYEQKNQERIKNNILKYQKKMELRESKMIEGEDKILTDEILVDIDEIESTSLSDRKEPFPLFGTSDTRRDIQRTIGLLLIGTVILIIIGSIWDYQWLGSTFCMISFLCLIVCGLLLIIPIVKKDTQVTSKDAFTGLVVFIVIIVLIVGALSWWVGGTTESMIYKSASDAVNNLESDIYPYTPFVTMKPGEVKYDDERLSAEITIHFSESVTYFEKELFALTAAEAVFNEIPESELISLTVWTSDFSTPKVFHYSRENIV